MSHTPCQTPPPLRVYTCYIDGVLHTVTFPHHGVVGLALDTAANARFGEWLEMTAPGAHDEGRVTGIRFADMTDAGSDHV